MKSKNIFKSKTALLGLLTFALGLAAQFLPETAGAWVSENSGAILATLGPLAIFLRRITSGRVSLFPPDPTNTP